jgi:hypothetical protein
MTMIRRATMFRRQMAAGVLAPQDALLITAGRYGDSYRVKSIDAFVFH